MGVNGLLKTVTRQRRDCDLILNPGPSAPESSTLTIGLPNHPYSHIHTHTLIIAIYNVTLESSVVQHGSRTASSAACVAAKHTDAVRRRHNAELFS